MQVRFLLGPHSFPHPRFFIMIDTDKIKEILKAFIEDEFASEGEVIDYSYPLMARGILDSIGSLRLVSFVEEKFNITFAPHEITTDHLGSIDALTAFILMKSANGKA